MSDNTKKVIIYGGNGFVGTHTAEHLVQAGAEVVCLSRTGHKPLQLKDQPWSCEVRWCKGDASAAKLDLLASADVMICLVGSPPLPTFSEKAYEQQLFMNGTSCVNAIESAYQAGITRIILLGAKVPFPLRSDRFAYFKGKELALSAAQRFADRSSEHTSIVLQPGMITGRRSLANGRAIRLDWLTAPIAPIMPWQFVSVDRVARRIADAALQSQPYAGSCTVITNSEI